MLKKISAAFTGGFVAAILTHLCLWYLGDCGLLGKIGVTLRAPLSMAAILLSGAKGGLWGPLFLLPILKAQIALRGLLLSLPPAIFVLCWEMPRAGQGLFALHYGDWTPLVIFILWVVWGMVGALWHKSAA